MPTLSNILETVLVLASPITQEELVSKEGEETVYLSRAQLDALNAQDLQTALRTNRSFNTEAQRHRVFCEKSLLND